GWASHRRRPPVPLGPHPPVAPTAPLPSPCSTSTLPPRRRRRRQGIADLVDRGVRTLVALLPSSSLRSPPSLSIRSGERARHRRGFEAGGRHGRESTTQDIIGSCGCVASACVRRPPKAGCGS